MVELLAGQGARRLVIGVEQARAAAARLHQAYGVDRMDSAEADPPAGPAAAPAVR